MKHINKLVTGIAFGAVVGSIALMPAPPAYADDLKGYEVKVSPEGNWIREGGLNRYDGSPIESAEDAQETERCLQRDGYIELNTLTPEEYSAFVGSEESTWWFEQYVKPSDSKYIEYYDNWFKIYIFEPSFRDWWDSYVENGENPRNVSETPRIEISNSSVVIDYRTWWSIDRMGADLSDEMNDGIPSWCDTGYICITSPIDAEITFTLTSDSTYYTVYVSKDTPFRAKMKYGGYHITKINGVEIKSEDKNAPLYNNIQVGWGDNLNLESPVDINIEKTVQAYSIPPADISGKPDRSLDKNQNIPSEEKAIIKDEVEDGDVIQTEKPNWFKRIIIILLIVAVAAGFVIYKYLDKKRKL